MTTHAYFNLNGHNSSTNITDHTVQLHSSYYTPVYNNTIVPTGEVAPVAGTAFDLRQPTLLSTVIDKVLAALEM
jgi:aldose 1-epimerase